MAKYLKGNIWESVNKNYRFKTIVLKQFFAMNLMLKGVNNSPQTVVFQFLKLRIIMLLLNNQHLLLHHQVEKI